MAAFKGLSGVNKSKMYGGPLFGTKFVIMGGHQPKRPSASSGGPGRLSWVKGGRANSVAKFRAHVAYNKMLDRKWGRHSSLPAKSGGGSSSRSEAARKAWRTRRGH